MLKRTVAFVCALGAFGQVATAQAELLLVELHSPNLSHAEHNSYHFVEDSPLYLRASTYDKLHSIKYVEFYRQNAWGQFEKLGDDHSRASDESPYYDMTLSTVAAGPLTLMVKGVTFDGRVINSKAVTIDIKPVSDLVSTTADLSQPMKQFSGTTSIATDQIASMSMIWDGFIANRGYETNRLWLGIEPEQKDHVQTHTISHQVITKSGEVFYSKPQQLVTLAQDCAKEWQSEQSYWANDYVYYQGFVYRSAHWSHNQAPNAQSQWGPWQQVAECE